MPNTTAAARKWPSREEWAKEQRQPYTDLLWGLAGRALADYATPAEIDVAVADLKRLHTEEGRAMRAAKLAAGALCQQSGETRSSHNRRWCDMTKAEQDLLWEFDRPQKARKAIRKALAAIESGCVDLIHCAPEGTILPAILARYDAADRAAVEARCREIEATPIDDEAWAAELHRRAEIDRGPSHPSDF